MIVLDKRSFRKALDEHRALALAYVAGVVVALAVIATGHSVLGTYATTAHGNPLPLHIVRSFAQHLATIALGLGILPFLVGGAWLASNAVRAPTRERRIFALLASVAIVLLTIEVASFDLRFGGGVARDRYLFYIVPLILIAFAAALASDTWPRRSLAVPLVVLVYGFARDPLPLFDKLNVDTPVAMLDNYLRGSLGGLGGARIFLIAAAVVGALLVLEGALLLRHAHLAVLLAVLTLVALPAETAYAFVRLFRVNGTAGRSLTTSQANTFAWVDQTVGRNAHVTAVPYPTLPGDYWSSVAFWWDLEFWNKSVDRSAWVPGQYGWTPATFPKLELHFDRTGRASVSPPGDVAQAIGDARFHIAGTVLLNDRGVFLVQPEQPWRADWLTTGLYDDGWTKPHAAGHIRVFAYPGQTGRRDALADRLRASAGERRLAPVHAGLEHRQGDRGGKRHRGDLERLGVRPPRRLVGGQALDARLLLRLRRPDLRTDLSVRPACRSASDADLPLGADRRPLQAPVVQAVAHERKTASNSASASGETSSCVIAPTSRIVSRSWRRYSVHPSQVAMCSSKRRRSAGESAPSR